MRSDCETAEVCSLMPVKSTDHNVKSTTAAQSDKSELCAYRCQQCHKQYKFERNLRRHVSDVHGSTESNTVDPSISNMSPPATQTRVTRGNVYNLRVR